MIKNLAITTPVLGTIRLGDVAINPQGKRYPVRSNHFKITALYKDKDGHWVEHPMQQEVAKATGQRCCPAQSNSAGTDSCNFLAVQR